MKKFILHSLGLILIIVGNGCSRTTMSDSSDAVAMVNGTKISRADFLEQLEHIANFRVSRHFSDDQKKVVLQDLIQAQLLLDKAEAEKFAYHSPVVRRFIVTEYLRQYINEKYSPSDATAEKLYHDNQANIDNICLRHLLVGNQSRSEAQAKEKAEMIYNKLRKGADFVDMALFYSDDQATRESGGDLGCITRQAQLVPEFLEAAFHLTKVGDYSKPVKTQFGYHLIFLLSDRRGFAPNRTTIKSQLANQYRQQAFDALLIRAKEKAEIETYFDRLSDLNLSTLDAATESKKP